MTAVKSVSAETRLERMAREREAWLQEAINYMIELELFEPSTGTPPWAIQLAETLYEDSIGLAGIECTPKEALDEEMTYWGD